MGELPSRGSRRRRPPDLVDGPRPRALRRARARPRLRAGSRARRLRSTRAPSRSATARRTATTCSSAPRGTRPSTCASSMPWPPTSTSRRLNRYPHRTSRGCRSRQASGSQGELNGEEVRGPDKQGARTPPGRALLAGYQGGQSRLRLRPDRSQARRDRAHRLSTVGEQTEQIFTNLKAILDSCGSGLDRMVKATVFLARMEDFAEMNEVYKRHAGTEPPARSTVQVAKLPAGRARRDRRHRPHLIQRCIRRGTLEMDACRR